MSESEASSDDDFDPRELEIVQEIRRKKLAESGEGSEEGADDEDSKKIYRNNKVGLEAKLEEVRLPDSFHWIETLDVSNAVLKLNPEDVHDDLKREAAFYQHTVNGVKTALLQLNQNKIPWERPPDFFAEMLKPDAHMAKVKESLLKERARMDAVSERKKLRDQKKFAKQVQTARIQEKHAEKRDHMDMLKKIKKGSKHNELNVERTINDSMKTDRRRKSEDKNGKFDGKGKKRKAKDAKYGHGGRKRDKKRNDADSSKDMSGYSGRKNKELPSGFKFNKPSKSKKGGRPGKSRREAGRK